jgi:IstB-like ATP binding protein
MTPAASVFTPEMEARLGDLLTTFKLPTLSTNLAERLLKAGKADALAVVLDVCELEAQDRHSRRVDRLRKASDLPPGKTFETFKERVPKPLMQRMRELGRGEFLERAANVLMFGLPGVARAMRPLPSGMLWSTGGTPSSSRRRTRSSRTFWPPGATWPCRGPCAGSTSSTCSSSTTSATSSRARMRPRCSSP